MTIVTCKKNVIGISAKVTTNTPTKEKKFDEDIDDGTDLEHVTLSY